MINICLLYFVYFPFKMFHLYSEIRAAKFRSMPQTPDTRLIFLVIKEKNIHVSPTYIMKGTVGGYFLL